MERQVPGFDAPQDLVLQALIPDVKVVVGVELPLAVEIHVDMQPLADDPGGTDGILRIGRDRRESGAAAGERALLLLRRAPQVAELILLELEPQIQIHAEFCCRRWGGEGRRGGGGGRRSFCDRCGRAEQRQSSRENLVSPGARDERWRDARAQSAAGRQGRLAWPDERRHAKRVHRSRGSLRMSLGYDDREGESDYPRG